MASALSLTAFWLRLELRRRLRSLLVLALLVALSSGTVLTAVAGARRGETAVDRLGAATLPATAAVLPNEPGFDWDAVRALPGVEAVGEFPVTAYRVGDIPPDAYPDGFPSDRAMMDSVERPVVLDGRPADPDRADEAVVTAAFTRTYGIGVGDRVELRLYSPEQIETFYESPVAPEPAGPVVPVTVVGVVRSMWFSDDPGSPGQLQPSAGLLEQYRPHLLGGTGSVFVNALVRLADGPAAVDRLGVDRLRADLAALTGRDDIEMLDLGAEADKVRRTTAFEAGSLLAFGLAALAAAVVLVGQAVARYVAGAVADLAVLRAVGLDRRTAIAAAAVAPALAGLAGTAVGVGLAYAASPLFPVGTAAAFEPAPGPAADAVVLGGGPLLALLVAAGAAAAARAGLAGRADRSPRRSAAAALAARAGLPVPLLVGIRFALEPGRGRTALPVRPALLGAVTGVLGVLAAFTFSAGVADAAANPARFGQTQQLDLFTGENGVEYGPPAAALLEPMTADPDVVGALDARMGVLDVAATPVTVFAHTPVGPAGFPTVLRAGRMAQADDEIVLAPRTAHELGAALGDRLPVPGGEVTVTGIGFVPYAGHNNYDDGAWLSTAGYDRFVTGFKFHFGYVALRPGADAEAARTRLAALAAPLVGGDPAAVPMRVTEPLVEAAQIRNVEVLPLVLGGFLALLAVGAVGHALATAVRRRRHDVAVLRALGMTRAQARVVVLTQAGVLAGVGLLFGVPLGLAVGRVLWRFVADITPLQYEAPLALPALLLAVPVSLLVAGALAAWPGRQAARLRIGHVLRAE